MLSDAPNASWHPALMPNSIADLDRILPTDPLPSLKGQNSAAEPRADVFPVDDAPEDIHDKSVGPDGWFPDYGTGNNNWMDESADDAKAPTESANHDQHHKESQNEVPEIPVDTSQHTSRMSFARTAHEVNWNDDDEPEWNLTRTGTDFWKGMPPNDRTNSFPAVPPLKKEEHVEPEVPVPAQQPDDEVNQSGQVEATSGPGAFDFTSAADEDGFLEDLEDDENTSFPVMGGNVDEAAEDPSVSRFTEEVPLIASRNNNVVEENTNAEEPDLFAGADATEEDDFFSQVRQDENEQAPTVEEGFEELADATPEATNPTETVEIAEPEVTLEAGPGVISAPEKVFEEPAVPTGGALDWGDIDDEDGFLEDSAQDDILDKSDFLEESNKDTFLGESTQEDVPDASAFLPSDDEGFLPSDDEGLLDDTADEQLNTEENDTPITPTAPAAPSARYLPTGQQPTPSTQPTQSYFPAVTAPAPATTTPNIYAPAIGLPAAQPLTPFGIPSTAPPAPAAYGYGAHPAPPQPTTRAQSFADKSKGGYTSPYDLPMEVVKPKKRASMANLQKTATGPNAVPPVPPPRSASLNSPLPPPPAPPLSIPPQGSFSQPAQSLPAAHKPVPAEVKPKEKFFEDLPITTKPRPTSRQSNKSLPSPQASPYTPPPQSGSFPPPLAQQPLPSQISSAPTQPTADVPQLVAPPRVNPYASLASSAPTLSPPLPAATANRYSPAPASSLQPNGSVPPPVQSRYSPAPPISRQPSSGFASPLAASAPPILPHQPRTSSPLAHFEISHDKARTSVSNHSDGTLVDRRSSSSMYDPRLQRVPSLPPTREVEEEEGQDQPQDATHYTPAPQQSSPPTSRHAPLPHRPRQTPPPPPPPASSHLGPSPLSPPKRATSSHNHPTNLHEFAPPPRSQTQSPGALYGNRNGKAVEAVPRPSSVHDPAPPRSALYTAVPASVPNSASTSPVLSRPRAVSQSLNFVAPTDGREHDPLQRWRGAPLISWGVGGTIVTMFPKNIPRYGVHSSAPMVVRSPGEVKVQSAKDIQPLEDRLAKFPGPLKGKSKKKETISWLNTGIEELERILPTNLYGHQHPSHDDKRAMERILLWKILRLFVEHDGALEGNPIVEKAVREILLPDADRSGVSPVYLNAGNIAGLNDLPSTTTRSDAVDSSTVEQIRLHLLSGESDKAVWAAVDKRLWGHALLLSNALAPDLYRQVAQEFVKKEVNHPGNNNESLAALYEVLAGNHEECVDELVPVHARAGLQLMPTTTGPGSSKDALEGLDKWRESLGMILSNRSTEDGRAINSLGNLLAGYGRAEAAHICFLFARNQTVFGGLDDPASNFVLLGSDHKRQSEQFAKEIEPLLLSEVYEYGQTLKTAGATNVTVSNPHLAAYKFQHALALAEYGFRDKALQYCEAITTAITAQTKRSPYHHPILEAAVDDLMKRVKLAPKEESNSWIPKPSMNKVSDTMWNRFNKFVAGDENDASGQGSPKEEAGPFGRIAGGTPTISRPPSTNNLETFGAPIPSYGMPIPPANGSAVPPLSSSAPTTKAASRYAPGAGNPYDSGSAYAPRSSMERSSGEYNRSSLDLPRRSSEFQSGFSGSYIPNKPSPSTSYTPHHGQNMGSSQEAPYNAASPPQTSAPSFGYEPLGQSASLGNGVAPGPTQVAEAPVQQPALGGYQPLYGYEPPSQSSYEPPSQSSYEPPTAANNGSSEAPASSGFEPPSYQPYGYEPPTYEPDAQLANDDESDEDSKPKPKKKGIMYDDDEDDFGAKKPAEKTKEEKDRENAELFRKAAEEDAKRAAEAKQAKKGWGFSGWFGGTKKESQDTVAAPNKPVRAKLGEANSFYYDPDQKRWINKNAGPEENTAKKAAPPPPRSAPPGARSASSSPAPPTANPMPIPGADAGRASAPPPSGPPRPMGMTPPPPSNLGPPTSENGNPTAGLPGMMRSVSNTSAASAPPSRPTTSLSNSSSIDDLLAAAGPRKAGAKKPRKSARYVDVMTK